MRGIAQSGRAKKRSKGSRTSARNNRTNPPIIEIGKRAQQAGEEIYTASGNGTDNKTGRDFTAQTQMFDQRREFFL